MDVQTLLKAAKYGNMKRLQKALEKGTLQDLSDGSGETAVMSAAKHGQAECLKFLLNCGLEVNRANNKKVTALIIAAEEGEEQCLEYLLRNGAKVNSSDVAGMTALMHAAWSGNDACLQALIEAEAKINKSSIYGQTALMFACRGGHDSCVQTLIESGADINKVNSGGKTALLYAVTKGSSKCVQHLINGGVNINNTTVNGRTPLIIAVVHNYTNCARRLLDVGADPNKCDNSGKTVLMFACENNGLDCVKCLVAAGVDTNMVNGSGQTALMIAIINGANECVQYLARSGANLDVQDYKGKTAFLIAVDRMKEDSDPESFSFRRKFEICEILMEFGADANAGNFKGHSALGLALLQYLEGFDYGLIGFLLNNEANPCIANLTFHLSVHRIIAYRKNRIFHQLVMHGAVPVDVSAKSVIPSSSHHEPVSPFCTSLMSNNLPASHYCISNCYFTQFDVSHLPFCITVRKELREKGQKDALALLKDLYSNPWPLSKLCLVTVSTQLRKGIDRQSGIRNLGLPGRLQRMLSFQEESSQLSPNLWRQLRFTFDPQKYEQLAHSRPLAYNWPVRRFEGEFDDY